jgi:hypothetical protein
MDKKSASGQDNIRDIALTDGNSEILHSPEIGRASLFSPATAGPKEQNGKHHLNDATLELGLNKCHVQAGWLFPMNF